MCYFLDLRSDSKLAKFVSHKLIAALIVGIHLIIWVTALFTVIAPPASVKQQISESPAGAVAFAVIFILAGIGFSVLSLVGILKNNRLFIRVFCVFIIVMIALFVISILVNIFTQPARYGLSGFLSSTFFIFLNVLTYFILRNYYLSLSFPPTNNSQNHNPNGFTV